MAWHRTAVPPADALVARLDTCCTRSGRAHPNEVTAAVERFLEGDRDDAFDRALVDGYTRMPATEPSPGEAARQLIAAEPR